MTRMLRSAHYRNDPGYFQGSPWDLLLSGTLLLLVLLLAAAKYFDINFGGSLYYEGRRFRNFTVSFTLSTSVLPRQLAALARSEESPGGGSTPLYRLYRYVRPKGYGFSAILVINRVWFLYSS